MSIIFKCRCVFPSWPLRSQRILHERSNDYSFEVNKTISAKLFVLLANFHPCSDTVSEILAHKLNLKLDECTPVAYFSG